MANLKEIRTRIASVASTRKITSAMKMVSAAKFKKAQNNILRFRPFNEQINNILNHLNGYIDSVKTNYTSERKEIKHITLLVITSNNSMCGAFNSNIIKYAFEKYNEIKRNYPSARISILALGKKGEEAFLRKGLEVFPLNHKILDKPSIKHTKEFFNQILSNYLQNKTDKIYLAYNRFRSAASQDQVFEQYLPININKSDDETSLNKPIIEPNPTQLLEKILPYFLLNKLHSTILESIAAEHGARMTAMHQATENANTLHQQLVIEYNKARQASITNEILEIVSGANALSQE
jgi:F-type H+-transporting ATPase subunit gamma